MRRTYLAVFTFVALLLFTANLKAGDVQGQLQTAIAGLKREIKTDVTGGESRNHYGYSKV